MRRGQRIHALAPFALLVLVFAPCFHPSLAVSAQPPPTSIFVNEIHYDNTGTDTGEAIEIAAPAGTDLSGWSVVLYNGVDSRRSPYHSDPIGAPAGACGGFDLYLLSYPSNGIQNGSPDGLALVDASGRAVQFLSYEGAFTGAGGPAGRVASLDIGVTEDGSTPEGHSLQLGGTAATYAGFAWNRPAPSTFGACNHDQTFEGELAPAPANPSPSGSTTRGSIACNSIPCYL